MVVLAVKTAVRASGMTPVGAGRQAPPTRQLIERYGMFGWRKNQRAGHQLAVVGLWRTGRALLLELLPVRFTFGSGHITGRFDKAAEVCVGHVVLVHPEAVQAHAMGRAFIVHAVGVVGAHGKFAGRNPAHAARARGGMLTP